MMGRIVTIPILKAFLRQLSQKFASKVDLSKVATSGSYNDLIDKPEAPDFQCSPKCYLRSQPFVGSKRTMTIPPWMVVDIDGSPCISSDGGTIDISNTNNWDDNTYSLPANRKGKDFYIYAVRKGNEAVPDFILSKNPDGPAGYEANTVRKVGGFHCLCEDMGEVENHPLSGFTAGDILPQSVWDLKHRPISSPEGMVFTGKFWVDIYLNSWDGTHLVSSYRSEIADTDFDGLRFQEALVSLGKRLPSAEECMTFSQGAESGKALLGEADPVTSGGHRNTDNRRVVSNIGCEDVMGVMWQYTRDVFGAYCSYEDDWNSVSSTNGAIQGGGIRRLCFGGSWKDGEHAGIHALSLNYWIGGQGSEYVAARGVSDPLIEF